MSNIPWWGNVLLAVAAGIASNFATSGIRWWIEKRSLSSQSKNEQRIKQEYEQAAFYTMHPEEFTLYILLKIMIMVAATGAIVMLQVCIFLAPHAKGQLTILVPAGTLGVAIRVVTWVFQYGGSFLGLFSAISLIVYFLRTTERTIGIRERVAFFERYVGSVPENIRIPELEARVMAYKKKKE
jgi:hypothetical protein